MPDRILRARTQSDISTPGMAFATGLSAVAILNAGFHPRGTFHRHRQSQVSALTLGYARDVVRARAGNFGAGADVTGYAVPANLDEPYGSRVSFHVFMRYRAPRQAGTVVPVH